MNEGIEAAPGVAHVNEPMVTMIDTEIQWTVKSGPVSHIDGRLAVGVMVLPTGQPRVVIGLKHADGKELTAPLAREACKAVVQMLLDAMKEADAVGDAAKAATRQ